MRFTAIPVSSLSLQGTNEELDADGASDVYQQPLGRHNGVSYLIDQLGMTQVDLKL